MSLPEFAPFPDAQLRRSILTQEWELYIESWNSLAELYLRLNDQQFFPALSTDQSSLAGFLVSYFHEATNDGIISTSAPTLRKRCFQLLHRIFSAENVPSLLLKWSVLSDMCRVFPKSEQFRSLLGNLWKRSAGVIEPTLQLAKNSLTRNLDSKMPESSEDTLNKVVPLLRVSPDAGTYMVTGSDFLDSLCAAYPKVPSSLQKKLTTTAYLVLTALLEGSKPSYSLLSDHLYSLKTSGEQQQKAGSSQKSLVADLVTNTPFLSKIRENATAPEAARVKNFGASLHVFQQPSIVRPKNLVRRKVDKGKSKAVTDSNGHIASSEMHIHQMSFISQIQDLFPDLGSGYVAKLLHEYNDNIEQITAHLLEDSLPPHLASADRNEQL
jgi:activating signal cointegrator complex subunit 2